MRSARHIGAYAVAAVLGLGVAGYAQAASQDPTAVRMLTPIGSVTPVSSYGSVTAWSERVAPGQGEFRLVLQVGSTKVVPAIGSRGTPFDVDLGPGPDGRLVAAYSRCSLEPAAGSALLGTLPRWSAGRGCDIYLLDVMRDVETKWQGSTSVASEYLPSIWRSRVAFARVYQRRAGRRGQLPYIYLRPLDGGRSQQFRGGPRGGANDGPGPLNIDLYGRRALFTWSALRDRGEQTQIRLADAQARSVRVYDDANGRDDGAAVVAAGMQAGQPYWTQTYLGARSRPGASNFLARPRSGRRNRERSLLFSDDVGVPSASMSELGLAGMTSARGQAFPGDCEGVRPACAVQLSTSARFVPVGRP